MNFIRMIVQWRKRREAVAEEKRKMLRERLARVLSETQATRQAPRIEPRYRGTVQATRG